MTELGTPKVCQGAKGEGGSPDLQELTSGSENMLPGPAKGPDECLASALVAILETSASYIYLKIMVDEMSAVMVKIGIGVGDGRTLIITFPPFPIPYKARRVPRSKVSPCYTRCKALAAQ